MSDPEELLTSRRESPLRLLVAYLLLTLARLSFAGNGTIVDVGLNDAVKLARWVPITVEPIGVGGPHRLTASLPDPAGQTVTYHSEVVDLSDSETITVLVQVADPEAGMTLTLYSVDEQGADSVEPERIQRVSFSDPVLRLSTTLVGTVGPFDRQLFADDESIIATTIDPQRLDTLPSLGLDACDVILVTDPSLITVNAAGALRDWTGRGGHLVLSLPPGFDASTSPLFDWVRLTADRTVTVREFSSLETFAFSRGAGIEARAAEVTELKLPPGEGIVRASTFDTPLLIRLTSGGGVVTALGFSLSESPWKEWSSLDRFARRLISTSVTSADSEADAGGSRLSSTGITDLGTQFLSAQEQLLGASRPSFILVVALALGYLLLIGLLDYLLVHHLLKKPTLGWVTLPVWVLLGLGGLLLFRGDTGSASSSARLALVDIDATSGAITQRDWLQVRATETERYEVEAPEPLLTGDEWGGATVGWTVPAEDAFGGLYRPSALRFGETRYDVDLPGAAVRNLPLVSGSVKSFLSVRQGRAGEDPIIESELTTTGSGQLEGQLTNMLPGKLVDWRLAFQNRVYFPRGEARPLEPLAPWVLSASTTASRNLKADLTKKRLTAGDEAFGGLTSGASREEAYDPASDSLDDILAMLSFHEAATGSAYTSLSHELLGSLELTPALRLGRAVLLAKLEPKSSAEAGSASRVVYVRVLLPVRKVEVDDSEDFIGTE